MNFFENISHVQIHRRMRAMHTLRKLLSSSSSSSLSPPTAGVAEDPSRAIIAVRSFVHVLLPIVFHFLFSDADKVGKGKDSSALRFEAAAWLWLWLWLGSVDGTEAAVEPLWYLRVTKTKTKTMLRKLDGLASPGTERKENHRDREERRGEALSL
jgi:hypothetical protein